MKKQCIYYESKELTYNKQEHVVPAGLGGTLKLPKGYVSDQANEMFSKLEAIALRTTLIAGVRNYIGPAHRGKMTPHRKNNPHIQLLKLNEKYGYIQSQEMKYKLGFTLDKKAYFLSQILISLNNNLIIDKVVLSGGTYDLKESDSILKTVLPNKIDYSKLIPIQTEHRLDFFGVVIGRYYDNLYVYCNVPFVTTKRVVDIINNQPWNNKIVNTSIGGEYDFSYKLNGGIKDDSLYFLLAKTAFNVLAYQKGQEFVLSSCFNDIRSKIISNTALCLVKEFDNHKIEGWIKEKGKDESHIVVIGKQGKEIIAYVSFYGDWIYKVVMSTSFEEPFTPFAFVSSWRNKKDVWYDLTDFY